MSHFAFVSSPFGNFAVQATDLNNHYRAVESYRLTPLGSLEEVPFTKDGYIDQEALAAEALRQLEARGESKNPYLIPQCTYTVNNATYTADLTAETVKDNDGGTFNAVSASRYDAQLTASASKKFAAWWDSVKETVITEEFHARTELERAEYAHGRAVRTQGEALAAVAEATEKLEAAAEKLAQARAAVKNPAA